MKRIVQISPAFDKRHPDPNKDYGIHGCDLRMVLKGELGAVQFVLFTGWHLTHVVEEFKYDAKFLFEPSPADVGYHSPHPMYDGQAQTGECEYLDGKPCYYDGSGLYADTAFKVLVEKGSDGLWKFLEDEYVKRFGELK